jgi:hypothetical protein
VTRICNPITKSNLAHGLVIDELKTNICDVKLLFVTVNMLQIIIIIIIVVATFLRRHYLTSRPTNIIKFFGHNLKCVR